MLTRDKLPKGELSPVQTKKAERYYTGQLRKIARIIGELVAAANPDTVMESNGLVQSLRRMSEVIKPWATVVANSMIHQVNLADAKAWREHSAQMGRLIRHEIFEAPTGRAMRGLLTEQVGLITSLPLEAATRVHDLTIEGLIQGTRAKEISSKIMETGEVTKARADLIARTEVGRTSTTLTKTRAEAVASTHFIWRTSEDAQVRPRHAALNGKVFRWDDPPECDPGHHALPGCIWNCRCIAEPVIPTSIFDHYRRIA